jgi:hypothetical protein
VIELVPDSQAGYAQSAIRKLQFERTFFHVKRNPDSWGELGGTKMPCRGIHLAVTSDQLASLLAASNDADLKEVIDQIETAWDEENLAQSDKAWDAIHRCLTDDRSGEGSRGEYPLNHVISGGRPLHRDGEEMDRVAGYSRTGQRRKCRD